IRDERAGNVPYRLYGRASSAQEKAATATNFTRKTCGAHISGNATRADTKPPTDKFTEKDIENIYAKYHELIEPDLKLLARQKNVAGKAIDLLFEDKNGQKLIVEIKKGTAQRSDIGQLIDYLGYFVAESGPPQRAMLIAHTIPSNFKKSLEHFGIEYLCFTIPALREEMRNRGDLPLLSQISN
ncbi:MAG: endonuclease NucS, partial [Desulfuromonadaceae bacterium]|nr:endonuclease NucS [Desulfuromonadaceae bacterium]